MDRGAVLCRDISVLPMNLTAWWKFQSPPDGRNVSSVLPVEILEMAPKFKIALDIIVHVQYRLIQHIQ